MTAQGAASFFDVSEATNGHIGHATAFAETDIDFTSNGVGSLALDLDRGGVSNFAFGSISLFDLTTGQLLWTYALYALGCQGPDHCALAFDQLFNPDHVYRLTETAQSGADGDSESVHLHVSGLAVPEPSIAAARCRDHRHRKNAAATVASSEKLFLNRSYF